MFEVGDLIIGTKRNWYSITSTEAVCEVVSIFNNSHITVRVVEILPKHSDKYIARQDIKNKTEYDVDPGVFKKYMPYITDIKSLPFTENLNLSLLPEK